MSLGFKGEGREQNSFTGVIGGKCSSKGRAGLMRSWVRAIGSSGWRCTHNLPSGSCWPSSRS